MRFAVPIAASVLFAVTASAQPCVQQQVQNYTGGGTVACPCFATGEQAGSVLAVPAEHFPIEILRVGVGWGSAFGGAPNSVESAIHIYPAGLPNPGTPVFSLEGPVLHDGFINEFNLEPLPGEITLTSGPFMVSLEFANSNAGDPFAATVVHDGSACQSGKNTVYDGTWRNACQLGVSGDWVFYAVYRCLATDRELEEVAGAPILFAPRPNPFTSRVAIEFHVATGTQAALEVFDVSGRRLAELSRGMVASGRHLVEWDGRDATGNRLQAGVYLVELRAGSTRSSRKIVLR
jgi:FlgD Ig-like domain